MARADRSKVIDLFSEEFEPVVAKTRSTKPKQKKSTTQSKGVANQKNREHMMSLLEDESYGEFNEKDWFQYFILKGEEQGVKYLARNYAKDYTIIKSILSELSWVELKLMIDFVWESNQDIQPKQTLGIWIMSKGWINTIYQNSLLWRDGKYRPKSAPTHNREWIAEASTKSSESIGGLSYGKPIKEKSPMRSGVSIGWQD